MSIKILVIEDNPDVRENTCELLELSGYEIVSAVNGKEGVKKAKEEMPQLIICDIMMPELDGYGVLQILSKEPRTASIPFIFLTAKAEKEDFRKGMSLGADDYMTKPFDESDLLSAIENRLKKYELFRKNYERTAEGLNVFFENARKEANLESLTTDKKISTYKAKETLYREGETPNRFYFLNSGRIKVYKIHEDGKEYITEMVEAGEFFGLMPVLNSSSYADWAQVMEDSEIISIQKEELFELLQTNRDVANGFIRMLANNVGEREEQLLKMAYDTVRKRVVDAIVKAAHNIAKENGAENIVVNYKRDHLAQVVGTATETTIRVISELKKDGLINTSGSKIEILNLPELESIKY